MQPLGSESDMAVNKRTEFFGLTALVVLTRVGDGITTYLVTPDLAREMNPLAAGGWWTLIFFAAVILALSIWLNYQNLFRPIDNFPNTAGQSYLEFKRHYFDPKHNKVLETHLGRVIAYIFGFIMPRTLILWSLLLIVNNIMTLAQVTWYVELKKQYPIWILFYAALPLLALVFLELLQRRDYDRYQSQRTVVL
jgi:hypothetical protein